VLDEVILISCFTKFTDEITSSFELAGTVSEKEPSSFVVVPKVVPLTSTEALVMGAPFSSSTLPVMTLVCATRKVAATSNPMKVIRSFLIFSSFMSAI
jgi:hypothetical protein